MQLRSILLLSLIPLAHAEDPYVTFGDPAYPRLRFERPVFLTGAGDDSGRLFVVEQDGVIRVFPQHDPNVAASAVFLDISAQVSRRGNEEGLLGLAFAPDYATSGAFYVHYSSSVKDMHGIVSRFRVSADDPDRADPASEQVVLEQQQPYRNHNGGTLAFGPDGMLYISFGDGGAADDPHGNGQDLSTWLGAILRVDVSGDGPGYEVPDDNPFVGVEGARPEIWAYGLRNAWRFSFDRETGDLWAADVGQNKIEEVDIVVRGGNYGWNNREASQAFDKGVALRAGSEALEPVGEYGRSDGISITGGFVYRGGGLPELDGVYLFGDYVTGNVWSLRPDVSGGYQQRLERRTGRSIASFGEDDDGHVYLCSFDGRIYGVGLTNVPVESLEHWPRKLSKTGLFESVRGHELAAHVVPYDVNAPFWSDGAEKQRFFALPAGASFGYSADGVWDVPVGATLGKSFSAATMGRKPFLETRLIKRTESGWEAATYIWNDQRSDATLAPDGQQFELWNRSGVTSWHAPSASECASCHVQADGFALGITTAQLHKGEQLTDFVSRGLVRDFDADGLSAYPSPHDPHADLELRARTYLDVNCAMCHRPEGSGNAAIDLRFATPLAETGMLDGEVAQGDLGVEDARIVAPGAPARSILLERVSTRGDGRMPNVATNAVDEDGVQLLTEWIESLPQDAAQEPESSGFVALFDGESLAGWTQRNGTATYAVEDGAIVGRTADGSPNSFLCTERGYSDFELRFEVQVDNALNSGVQIRSNTKDGPTGRVNGPQVEIEASGRNGAEAGYLYAEAAGGWMTPEADRAPHKHFKDGAWNAYRVLAVGARIQVWLNGEQVSDLVHEKMYGSHPRGFIGLQVHGIGRGQGPFEVRWRNIELREVRSEEAGWKSLYNGKNLDGWKTTGNWLVEKDGVLSIRPRAGEQGWQRFGDYLWSEQRYEDFILDLEYSYPAGGNSGVYFRVDDRDQPVTTGIEAQILDSSRKQEPLTQHDHGGIISTAAASRNMSAQPGEWNRMIVTMRGKHLTVDLNGANIIDLSIDKTGLKDRPARGYIGLQDHGEPHELSFRNIRLKAL